MYRQRQVRLIDTVLERGKDMQDLTSTVSYPRAPHKAWTSFAWGLLSVPYFYIPFPALLSLWFAKKELRDSSNTKGLTYIGIILSVLSLLGFAVIMIRVLSPVVIP